MIVDKGHGDNHGDNKNLIVTGHARDKWRQITGSLQDDNRVSKSILKSVGNGFELHMKRGRRLNAMMRHNFKEAKYMSINQGKTVAVIIDNKVITAYNDTNKNVWLKNDNNKGLEPMKPYRIKVK